MSFGSLLVLAVGLAMDATAAAAARALRAPRLTVRDVLLVSTLFGGFQAAMPVAGWWIGSGVGPAIEAWDHWVAFALLAGVGTKAILESFGPDDEPAAGDPFGMRVLVLLAVATSIDAFAVGVTLPMIGAPLVASVATIGVTTAALSVCGLFAGRRFGALLGRRLEAMGGLVLIGLGSKILVEHLAR